jgi:hypothetical protein
VTEDINEIIASININNVLAAILKEYGKLTVPVLDFLNAEDINKELVIDYDEEGPSFTFSLGDKNEQ